MRQCFPPAFVADTLSIQAGSKELLQEISFSLSPGEMLILAGPNGIGKSRLLRAMAGLSAFSSGTFRFLGENISDMPPKKRSRILAYLPQIQPSAISLTVEETIALGRFPWKKTFNALAGQPDEICIKYMKETDTLHLRYSPWQQLSGGERQRVSLARILSQKARLLLLDEPTTALDYKHQLLIMDLLRDECRDGQSIIMVTHDLNLAAIYADKAMLVGEGRCIAYGPPAKVFASDNLEQAYHCRLLVDYPQCEKIPRISLPLRTL